MRKLWRVVVNTIFWSYERGSWPYDVMVVLIVLFVLLTPARWFHDQPQSGGNDSGIVLITEDDAARTQTYRIDASLFAAAPPSQKNGPELERQVHEILSRSAGDLKTQTFQIRGIQPIRGAGDSIRYYQVEVKR